MIPLQFFPLTLEGSAGTHKQTCSIKGGHEPGRVGPEAGGSTQHFCLLPAHTANQGARLTCCHDAGQASHMFTVRECNRVHLLKD